MRLFRRRRRAEVPLTCHEVAEVLQTYLDRELDETTTARVAAHLEDCRRCGLEAETYEHLKVSLRHGPAEVGDDAIARLRAFGERLARGEVDPDELSVGGG